MSFSAGTFSINSTGQPVVAGTTISASVFNSFTSDIATGLSTCMLKDGTQTATAGIGFFAGTVSLPGITFGTDTATGFYRIGLNNTGFAINGTKLLDLSAALVGITGALTVSTTANIAGATTLQSTLAVTGAATLSNALNVAVGSGTMGWGTYTPTMTAVTNISSITSAAAQYSRNGNVVTVSGTYTLSVATGALPTEFGISLPIASDFSNGLQCGGMAAAADFTEVMPIFSDSINNRADVFGVAANTTNSHTCAYTFTYQIV